MLSFRLKIKKCRSVLLHTPTFIVEPILNALGIRAILYIIAWLYVKAKNKNTMNNRKEHFMKMERVSNDIDILVSQADLNNIQILLNELGFKQGYYDLRQKKTVEFSRKEVLNRRMNRGETAPFIFETRNQIMPFIEIDINFSLGYTPQYGKEMLNDFLKNTFYYSGKVHGGLSSLNIDDFFLQLIRNIFISGKYVKSVININTSEKAYLIKC